MQLSDEDAAGVEMLCCSGTIFYWKLTGKSSCSTEWSAV